MADETMLDTFRSHAFLRPLGDRLLMLLASGARPFRAAPGDFLARDGEPAHAFYLGYELAKAVTALTLGKDYVQDQALRWGFLTVPEESHRAKGK